MAELKIKADSGGGTVSFKGPATTTSNAAVQLTLPVDDGTSGQYLKTDGSGALSWATVDTSIADDSIVEAKLDVSNAPTNGQFLQAQSGEGGGLTWAGAGNGTWSTMTKVALSGAASREFTGYPANTQMIIFGWDGMSHGASTGTDSSDWYVQAGTGSTTYATSGYKHQAAYVGGGASLGGAGGGSGEYTDSIEVNRGGTAASKVHHGHLIFYHLGDNIWTITTQSKAAGDNYHIQGFGTVTLSAALSALKVYTHYQANNFDAGTMYTRYLTHD